MQAVMRKRSHGKNKESWSKARKKENLLGWAFISVSLVGYLLFRILPVLMSFVLAFCDWSLLVPISGLEFVGFDNFVALWKDDWFKASLINNFVYTLVGVPVTFIISMTIATVLNNGVYLKSLIRFNFYFPNVASVVAISIVWAILYEINNGPINTILRSIGIENPPGWLSSSKWALLSLIIIYIWQTVGYCVIILLAGLQGVSPAFYESADLDGANVFQKFFYITIPSMSSTIFFILVISIIDSFKVFTTVNVMTSGGPGSSTSVLAYYVYKVAFNYNKIGYASAISWVLFVIIFVITIIQFAHKGNNEE